MLSQSQEEMILNLETDLRESQTAVEERDKDIENIHKTHKKSKEDEASTIQAMHSQMAELQTELQVLRSVTKAQGETPRSQDDTDGGRGLDEQRGHELSERSDRASTPRDLGPLSKSEHSYTPGGFAVTDQEDSGHQSFGQQSRDPQFSPEGQSLSPRQLRPYAVQVIAEDMQRTEASQAHISPSGSGVVNICQDHRSSSGSRSGSRPGSAHTASSRGSSRRESPHTVGTQDFIAQAYSPPTRDSPRSHSSLRSESLHDQMSPVRSSPVEAQYEQSAEGHRSPSRSSPERLDQIGEGSRSLITRSPNGNKRSSGSSSPRSGKSDHRGDSIALMRSPAFDIDGEDADRLNQQSVAAERQTVGASFTIDEDRQVYQAGTQSGSSEIERYVNQNAQLFDRDGNIRPRYSQGTESRTGQDISRAGVTSPETERAQYLQQHPSEGQEALHSRSQTSQGQGVGPGEPSSSEAERYIQQLRRELLITKTALMQIQRGERLDQDDIAPVDLEGIGLEDRSNVGQTTTALLEQRDNVTDRGELRYDTLPSEENLNQLKRKLERAEEEIQLFRSSSNLSARDFVQASLLLFLWFSFSFCKSKMVIGCTDV